MNARLCHRASRIWELSNTIGSTESADEIPADIKVKINDRAWAGLRRLGVEQMARNWADAVQLAQEAD